MLLSIKLVDREELSQYEKLLEQDGVYLGTDFYKNGVERPEAVHKYFVAYDGDRPAGTIAMTRYLNTNENNIKIYHRCSYTFPEYRGAGVWKALMNHKIRYCDENNWNEDDKTIHHVVVKLTDERYSKLDWNLHTAFTNVIANKKVHRASWYTSWGEMKNKIIA